MKPTWDNAPEWANWLGQSDTGIWRWFEHEPVMKFSSFIVNKRLKVKWNRTQWAGRTAVEGDWWETLEQRPGVTTP